MLTIELKTSYVNKIKSDPILFGRICRVLDVVPGSLIRLLAGNHVKLTQAAVLKEIAEYLKVQDISELLDQEVSVSHPDN